MLDFSVSGFRRTGWFSLCLLLEVFSARAAVEFVPDGAGLTLFGNGKRTIQARFRNSGDQATEAQLSFRLYQASSSTLAPLGETRSWRTVPLGIGQTVLEPVEVELPPVRGETGFQIVWFDARKKLGATSIRVFPDGILQPLATLAGDAPVGLVDPEGQFKAALGTVRVQELKDAEDISAAEVRLILIAPTTAANQPAGLLAAIKKKASGGAAVIWVQPPRRHESFPEAYVLDERPGRVVIATPGLLTALADSPRAQLNLLRLAELATGRTKLDWPADPQP